MDVLLLRHEAAIRSGVFFGAMAVALVWEALVPCRAGTRPTLGRWVSNLGLYLANTLVVYGLLPVLTVGMALLADARGWGLLRLVDVSPWVAVLLSLTALDLLLYTEHRLFHHVPWLWRLHRVHHADPDYDFTTALRFHPFEAVLESVTHVAVVAALGAPVLAVVLFEALVGGQVIVSHANGRLHLAVDQILRRVLVTPDLHRVHHSAIREETDSNFGSVLSVWDRLFRTYRAQPAAGHARMALGLTDLRDPRRLTLPWLLALPFVSGRESPSSPGSRAPAVGVSGHE